MAMHVVDKEDAHPVFLDECLRQPVCAADRLAECESQDRRDTLLPDAEMISSHIFSPDSMNMFLCSHRSDEESRGLRSKRVFALSPSTCLTVPDCLQLAGCRLPFRAFAFLIFPLAFRRCKSRLDSLTKRPCGAFVELKIRRPFGSVVHARPGVPRRRRCGEREQWSPPTT